MDEEKINQAQPQDADVRPDDSNQAVENNVHNEFLPQKTKKQKALGYLTDALFFVLGSFIYAVSINVFSAPNDIAPGGFSGIATMINHLVPQIPVGVAIIVLNLPLFILGLKKLGLRFMIKTLIGTVMISVMIDVTSLFLPEYHGDKFLAVVYGGVLGGLGLGFIFLRGGTTGGTDLIAKLLSLRFRFLSMGRLVTACDCVIVICTFFVYQSMEAPLYAMVYLFVMGKFIDIALYGNSRGRGKAMLIISKNYEEIKERILKDVDRGVTELYSKGGYSGKDLPTLLVAAHRQDLHKIYAIIKKADKNAFVIVCDAEEVRGEGFMEKFED